MSGRRQAGQDWHQAEGGVRWGGVRWGGTGVRQGQASGGTEILKDSDRPGRDRGKEVGVSGIPLDVVWMGEAAGSQEAIDGRGTRD